MLALVVMACLCTAQASATAPQTPRSAAEGGRIRLADAYMREAFMMVSPTDILPNEIEAAIYLSRQSALMIPDEPERWRVVLGISSLAAEMLPLADAVSREAIEHLTRLCPNDEVVRLRRLVGEIDKRETVEDRTHAYEVFTTPEAVRAIGTDVAARLEFDFALFESRRGDTDGFAKHLERSLLLAPSFPAAAETAAGFIAERIDDPLGEGELLVTAAMANPVEVRLWSRLSALLMQEGAYDSGIRVNRIALECAMAQEAYSEVIDLMVSELVLALWGAGRETEALSETRKRLSVNREAFTDLVASLNPGLKRSEAATVPGPVSVLLTTIEAALESVTGDPEAVKAAEGIIATVVELQAGEDQRKRQREIRGIKGAADPAAAAQAATQLIDAATTAAILGADVKAIDEAVAAAEKRSPLDADTKAMFEGWKAVKGGDAAAAQEAFARVVVPGAAVQFGVARAFAQAGDRQGAARGFLAIATATRGTLIGLLANHELHAIVGQKLLPLPSVAKLDSVVASIPATMERYLTRSLPAISFKAMAEKRTLGPFDPIWYVLTLKNLTSMNLAVTPQGPIKEHVLLQPRLLMPGATVIDRLTPEIIPFDRKLDLAPNESMTMRWNFAWTGVGYRAVLHPVSGVILEFRGAANFSASIGGFKVGAFGVAAEVDRTEIEGVRVTPEWIASALASVASASTDEDVVNLVLLGYAIKGKLVPEETIPKAWEAIAEGFGKLPEDAQAWVVMAAPTGVTGIAAFLDKVRATTSPSVRAAYLLNYCKTTDDPQIAAAVRSGDQFAMYAALVVQSRFLREAARAEEKIRGEQQESQVGAREAAQQQGGEGGKAPAPPP